MVSNFPFAVYVWRRKLPRWAAERQLLAAHIDPAVAPTTTTMANGAGNAALSFLPHAVF